MASTGSRTAPGDANVSAHQQHQDFANYESDPRKRLEAIEVNEAACVKRRVCPNS